MASPATSTNGRRGPSGDRERSLTRPATGFSSTFHAFGTNASTPATPAATPRVSVRYGSRSSPGTVENEPVTSEPDA